MSILFASKHSRVASKCTRTPMLENGARMNQREFHQLYKAYPEDQKVELVGGRVYVASPLSVPHSGYDDELGFCFGLYRRATLGVHVLHNATTILGKLNEPQPDLTMRLLQEYGGQSWINEDEYLEGAAELFAEIAYSSQSMDMHLKKSNYKEAGVIEYLVVCIADRKVHWFDFRSGDSITPTRQGVYRSRVFPGLWIDGPALLSRDSKKLIAVIERGLASREHAAFMRRLQAHKRKKR